MQKCVFFCRNCVKASCQRSVLTGPGYCKHVARPEHILHLFQTGAMLVAASDRVLDDLLTPRPLQSVTLQVKILLPASIAGPGRAQSGSIELRSPSPVDQSSVQGALSESSILCWCIALPDRPVVCSTERSQNRPSCAGALPSPVNLPFAAAMSQVIPRSGVVRALLVNSVFSDQLEGGFSVVLQR